MDARHEIGREVELSAVGHGDAAKSDDGTNRSSSITERTKMISDTQKRIPSPLEGEG
jgi:hypothetical protein